MNRLRLPCLVASLLLAAFGALGCNETDPPSSPPTFGRPGDVTFVCFEKDGNRARPLSECGDPRDADASAEQRLFALVTQTESGTLATVDLGRGLVLDGRKDIPGFTFVDVGDLPVAVVVPEAKPDFTYVATARGEIGVFDTAAFRPLTDKLVAHRVQEPAVRLADGAQPSSLVVAPDGSALFVASANSGALFTVPICVDGAGCELGTLGTPIEVPLTPVAPGTPPDLASVSERYNSDQLCKGRFDLDPAPSWPDAGVVVGEVGDAGPMNAADSDTGFIDAGIMDAGRFDAGLGDSGIVGMTDGGAPPASAMARPADLAIDSACDGAAPCTPRLLVADEALPVLHVFEIDGSSLTPLAPIVTGTPTEAVVATPDVPTEIGGDEMTHYVYAIDHVDGSILALQDGKLLPVNGTPGRPVGRLDFGPVSVGTRAMALAVATPGASTARQCTVTGTSSRLRGVFLVASLSDARVVVFDIHDHDLGSAEGWDLDVESSDGTSAEALLEDGVCRKCPYILRRHQRRMNSDALDVSEDVVIGPYAATTPSYQLGSRLYRFDGDGTTANAALPALTCVSCPEHMTRVFANPRSQDSESETPMFDAGQAMPDAGPATSDAGGLDGPSVCAASEALICGRADPFFSTGESWGGRYEGWLPQGSGVGSFDADADRFKLSARSAAGLCRSGVQGSDALGPQRGDALVIVGHQIDDAKVTTWQTNFSDDPDFLAKCQRLRTVLEGADRNRAIVLPIVEAFDRELVLGSKLLLDGISDKNLADGLPANLAELRTCLHGGPNAAAVLLNFGIRARDTFVIQGASGTVAHRIVKDASGRCVTDESLPATQVFRAVYGSGNQPGPMFNNGHVAFALGGLPGDMAGAPDEVRALNIPLEPAINPVGVDTRGGGSAAVLPQQLRYSPTDERLYIVDIYRRGLMSVDLDYTATNSAGFEVFN